MRIRLEITTADVRKLVLDHIRRITGSEDLFEQDVKVEVRSRSSRGSEWEVADFRAIVDKEISS